MPFHDLNIIYTADHAALSHTLSFSQELGYRLVAITIPITGKLPAVLPSIPTPALTIPTDLQVLTRLTLTISDTTQNHRLASLNPNYDILALRPTTEKTLQLCCSSLDCDLISLDFSQRPQFILKFKTVASALQRGVRFEICYSPGISGGVDARRNLISGAASLIRATRGRGIILSSEARNALSVRAPWDVINLAQIWGLGQERGKEAVCEEAGKVVRLASLRRTSYRGVVDVISNGVSESIPTKAPERISNKLEASINDGTGRKPNINLKDTDQNTTMLTGLKRKASAPLSTPQSTTDSTEDKPLSKREMKRRAKKARFDGKSDRSLDSSKAADIDNGFPIRHENLDKSSTNKQK